MSIEKFRRIDLAMKQFEIAVAMFLNKGDYFSVITLAGAADVIFCEVVSRNNDENFTDFLIKEEGQGRSRGEVGREVNDLFFINDLKHLGPGEDNYIELNPQESACGAILKGLVNYSLLDNKNDQVITAFKFWIKNNLDPEKYNIHCDPNWSGNKK